MKIGIIGHGYIGTPIIPMMAGGSVKVDIFDDSDRNITITGDLLKTSTYNLTSQLPITRRERRLNERKSLKHRK